MESISTIAELRNSILLLEVEQKTRGEELRIQFAHTYRAFQFFTLLTSVVKKVVPSPRISENFLIGGFSLISGYLVKKIVAGRSTGLVRNITATAMQAGTSGFVARNADAIKGIAKFLFGMLVAKSKKN
jgi:hypothetical protein